MSYITDGKYTEPKCQVCTSEHRTVIEESIMAMSKSQKQICKEYGVKEAALSIHKNKHMYGNVQDRLKDMINTALLGPMQPETIPELLKLLEYVSTMQNQTFMNGKSEWQRVKESKLEKFKGIILNDKVPVEDKETIIRIAEYCFINEDEDFGVFLKALMG